MNNFAVGSSKKQDPFEAAKELSAKAISEFAEPSLELCLIFSQPLKNIENLLLETQRISQVSDIAGLSSDIIIDSDCEDTSASALLLNKGPLQTQIASIELGQTPPKTLGAELAEQLIKKKSNKRCLLLFCPNTNINLQEIISGIQQVMGRSFPILGAVSYTQHRAENDVFFAKQAKNDMLTGVLLSGDITVSANLTSSWKPLGKLFKVTKAKDNVIYSIDNKPAIDIYRNYFGDELLNWDKRYFHKISFNYPLGILIENREHVIRSGLIPLDDGSLICQGEVRPEAEIRIMISTKFYCMESANQVASKTLEDSHGKKINFVLLFSSIARYNLLGRHHLDEIREIKNLVGADVPVIGCRTVAEIGSFQSAAYLGESLVHNNSILMIAVGG